jgi:phenylalanyl-tRNA synthetase beta chain
MICAEDELGLGDEHDGILVLDSDAPVGAPVAEFLANAGQPIGDSVLDVAITPNRPDATSHVGVARDLSALTDTSLMLPTISIPPDEGSTRSELSISIESPEGCPRFVAMIVHGVTIRESPAWLQARLRAVGLRPRSNVVDITNYVMMELGQPLHAYDLDTIAGRRIIVRETVGESKFVTLDGKERDLPPLTVMVCDGEREIGIAGIMGGLNTEVTEKTSTVLIEGAYWNPTKIRSASKALGLQTDASYRFERGVDTDGQARAVARAAELVVQLGGGTLVEGILDIRSKETPNRKTVLRLDQIRRHLGREVDFSTVKRLLTAIGFMLRRLDDQRVECTIPTFRPDVTREIDVIEEIARLSGYDSFPLPETTRIPNFTPTDRPVDRCLDDLYIVLQGTGFREVYTNSLIAEDVALRFNDPTISTLLGAPVVTANAITSEMTTLRPTLLAGVLPILSYNANRGQQRLRLFEVGNIFSKADEENSGLIRGYSEHTSVLMLASGPREARSFDSNPDATDYFDIKGVMDALAERIDVDLYIADEVPPSALIAYGQAVRVRVNGTEETVGVVAMLSDEVAREFSAPAPVVFAELNLSTIVAARTGTGRAFRPVSRFPVVERDLAVVVDEKQKAGDLLRTVTHEAGDLLLSAEIFDVYRGKGIADHKKSIALSVRFGADRTLTDAEVDGVVSRLISALKERHGGELRA